MKLPAIVSGRNHFRCAAEMVSDAMERLPDQFKHEKFQAWLLHYTELTIKSVASNYGTAAQRGIEQAADLLCNPTFYAQRKRRSATEMRRIRERQAQEQFERKQIELCPTAEQIEDMAAYHQRNIRYHKDRISENEIALAKLAQRSPTVITVAPEKVQ